MNVLFFALEFAPNNITGSYRSIKFVKNLRRFGVNPIVITARAEDSFQCFGGPIDDRLMQGLEDVEIVRYPIKPLKNRFRNNKLFSIARQIFRIDEGLFARWPIDVDSLMDTYQPKAVIVTLPPFSMWRVVGKIKEKYDIPVITDMRDAWALWSPSGYFSKIHYDLVAAREKQLFNASDKIVGVTPQLVNLFQLTHPEIQKDKFSVIYNSFEASSFRVMEHQLISADRKIIRIGYIGSFYYTPRSTTKLSDRFRYFPLKDDWLYRSPYFFLKTLARVLTLQPELKAKIVFEFAGKIHPWLHDMIREFQLEANVKLHGFLDAVALRSFEDQCDYFLATAEKIEGKEHFCLPSKIFDYIKTGKPVLGFVTEGIQKEFLLRSGVGFLFDPDATNESARALLKLLTENTGRPVRVNEDYINTFSDQSQTQSLAHLIDQVVEGRAINTK